MRGRAEARIVYLAPAVTIAHLRCELLALKHWPRDRRGYAALLLHTAVYVQNASYRTLCDNLDSDKLSCMFLQSALTQPEWPTSGRLARS